MDAAADAAAGAFAGWVRRIWSVARHRPGGVAVAGWLALRLVALAVYWWGLPDESTIHPLHQLALFGDTSWNATIAERGYDEWTADHQVNLAFFPVYPMAIRLVAAIIPAGTMSVPAAAVLVVWLAGMGAAWAIFAVAREVMPARAAVVAAMAWGALPIAIVESGGFSESLFTLPAAIALRCVLRRQWAWAGLASLVAGLTRPTGIALWIVVGLACAIALVRRRTPGRERLHAAAGMVMAPAGWTGFVLWVGWRVGRPLGYLDVQGSGWGSRLNPLSEFVHRLADALAQPHYLNVTVVAVTVAGALICLAACFAQRMRWPLVAYACGIVLLAMTNASYWVCFPRFILPAFPLLFPPARALAAQRPWFIAMVLLAATWVSGWIGAWFSSIGGATAFP
ncbi:MAG: hypothetical protein LBK59_07895 [Bifidobacteriaceae bacterium]|jgi:hypothetical protein|nr:hypothetical protein [Bifidobacteriaceae bacterium]